MARALRERRERARQELPGLARLLETMERNGGNGGGAAAAPPAPAAAPAVPQPSAVPDELLLGGVAAAMALVKAHRMHGHLAARLDPLGSEPVGDPALEPERLIPKLTPELQARIPASLLRLYVPAETLADALPPPARDLLRHDRLRDRAHLRPRAPRLAPPGDRVGEVPPAAFRRRAEAPARAADRGRGNRALPPPRLPRPEAVLDRGPRRDDADARRGDRALRRGRGARGRDRHGAPRPPYRPRAHDRAAVRGDPARVRRRAHDRGRRLDHRRGAPATSSTTSAPRAFARRRRERSPSRCAPTRATSRRSTRSSRAVRARSRPTARPAPASTIPAWRCRS